MLMAANACGASNSAYSYTGSAEITNSTSIVEGDNNNTVCIDGTQNHIFTNSGTITNVNGFGQAIQIYDGSTTINNTGTITSNANTGIEMSPNATTEYLIINNSGTISGLGPNGYAISPITNTFILNNNSGTVTGTYTAFWINKDAYIYNSGSNTVPGTISSSGSGTDAISNWNFSTDNVVIYNDTYGVITGTRHGINNDGGGINSIINLGRITGTTGKGIRNSSSGIITNLVNGQGGSVTALTYTGPLPINYYLYVSTPTNYGQLNATSSSGSINFYIYTSSNYSSIYTSVSGSDIPTSLASSTLTSTTYSSVLSGISSGNITNKAGTHSGYNWSLVETSSGSNVWDLVVTAAGPSFC